MKFIVTSFSPIVIQKWSKEFNMDPKKMSAVFIDTAAEVYDKENQQWLKDDRQSLVDVGFNVEDYTITDKNLDDLKNDLAKYDLIFVSGGNTFYLLEKANKSGFTQLIKEDFFADKIYVGSSAGSALLSDDIEIVGHIDDPKKGELSSTKGIGVFSFVIIPHWGNEKFYAKFMKLIDDTYAKSISYMTLTDNEYLAFDSSEKGLKKNNTKK